MDVLFFFGKSRGGHFYFAFMRRVSLLVYSLSLHRHSYIGFILAFASSIHNKQQYFMSVHFRRAAFAQQLKSRVVLTLTKAAAATIRITLNLDGMTFTSESHTHPSHSETSRLLTSSLSLRVPVPRGTQCIRDM